MRDYSFLWKLGALINGHAHHFFLEVLLIFWVLWLIMKKSKKVELKLTNEEEENLIAEYQPEELVADVNLNNHALKPRVLRGKAMKHAVVDGVECLNFAANNYLGFIGDPYIEQCANTCIDKFGVGSCGPRGFYGTTDLHLALEKQLAEFMGTEDAVVYAYAFSTIASAIPAYAKRGDIIFVDEKANFAIQKGCDASRSLIKYFKHNDLKDLEHILEEQKEKDLKNVKKARRSRRFLVVEGIYSNTGQICPLPQLLQLRDKYKLRLFVDESVSFGVLGETGRGLTEHFNVPRSEVDLTMASLEHGLASIGGFCVGSSYIVDHQRLSGLGYCFSASLPPPQVSAAIAALSILDKKPQLVQELRLKSNFLHDKLRSRPLITETLQVSGDRDSPFQLVQSAPGVASRSSPSIISYISEKCYQDKIALSNVVYLQDVDHAWTDSGLIESLRIIVSVCHSEQEILQLIDSIEKAISSYKTASSIA